MTNVPKEIRDIWTDLYKLFDRHFLITGSDEEWDDFWNEAIELHGRSGNNEHLYEMIVAISDYLGDRIKQQRANNTLKEDRNGKLCN